MKFKEISMFQWPINCPSKNRTKLFLNKHFLIQVFGEKNEIIRLTVNRVARDKNLMFLDDISWDDLQEIKDSIGYRNQDAIEVYPAKTDVVNIANMRHLWVLPEKLNFVWRRA